MNGVKPSRYEVDNSVPRLFAIPTNLIDPFIFNTSLHICVKWLEAIPSVDTYQDEYNITTVDTYQDEYNITTIYLIGSAYPTKP